MLLINYVKHLIKHNIILNITDTNKTTVTAGIWATTTCPDDYDRPVSNLSRTAPINSQLPCYNSNVRLVLLVTARRAVSALSVLDRSRPGVSEVTCRLPSLIYTRVQMMDGWPNVQPEVDWLITSRTEVGRRGGHQIPLMRSGKTGTL